MSPQMDGRDSEVSFPEDHLMTSSPNFQPEHFSRSQSHASIHSIDDSTLDLILSHVLAPDPSTPFVLSMYNPRNRSYFPYPPSFYHDLHLCYIEHDFRVEIESTFNSVRLVCRAFSRRAARIFFTQNTFMAQSEGAIYILIEHLPESWLEMIRHLILRPRQMFGCIDPYVINRSRLAEEAIRMIQPMDLLPFRGLRKVEVVLREWFGGPEMDDVRDAIRPMASFPWLRRLIVRRDPGWEWAWMKDEQPDYKDPDAPLTDEQRGDRDLMRSIEDGDREVEEFVNERLNGGRYGRYGEGEGPAWLDLEWMAKIFFDEEFGEFD